jgi:hypothetical protein
MTEPRSSPAPEPHNAPMKSSALGESISLDWSIRWQANGNRLASKRDMK